MSTSLGPIAAQRERNARMTAQVESLAAEHAAAHAAANAESRALPVVLLPANTRPMVALPAEERAAFLAHLQDVMTRAFALPLRDNAAAMTTEEAGARADAGETMSRDPGLPAAMVAGGCGTCRGACCTAGGTHAFLKEESLVRVRAQCSTLGGDTADTPEAISALYVAALPETHYRGSCVFHARLGCTLPRALRSNLCNRYQCGGLTQLSRALSEAGASAAYIGAGDTVRLRRLALVSEQGVEPIPVG